MYHVKQNNYTEKLVEVATVYTLTYARNLVLWRNQGLINVAAEQMLSFISKNNVNFKHK